MVAFRGVAVPDHVLTRSVDSELVLLNLDNEEYYGLDEVGAAMWEAVTTAHDVDAAFQQLLERFDVDSTTLSRDLEHLFDELSKRGLVELDPS